MIESSTTCIDLKQGSTKTSNKCTLIGNKLKCNDTSTNKAVTITVGFGQAYLQNNNVIGGVDNFHLFVNKLTCISNIGNGSNTYSFRLNSDDESVACLIGNITDKSINKGNGTLTGLGNSFAV